MPTYDYQCQDCDHTFEVFASIKQKTAGLEPVCPQCQSHKVQQAFRSVMFIRDSGGGVGPAPAGGCCPGGMGVGCG